VVNVGSTIVAQAPKMAPHIGAMRERIAALLGLPPKLGRRRLRAEGSASCA
jgi:2C-methyl-D-erythritol 2,4-cyclodiphosphate synthase